MLWQVHSRALWIHRGNHDNDRIQCVGYRWKGQALAVVHIHHSDLHLMVLHANLYRGTLVTLRF